MYCFLLRGLLRTGFRGFRKYRIQAELSRHMKVFEPDRVLRRISVFTDVGVDPFIYKN